MLQVLQCKELSKKPAHIKDKLGDLRYQLKVSPAMVTSKAYQDAMVTTSLSLLLQHTSGLADSVAFPELIIPMCMVLKRFAKTTAVHRLRKQVQTLVAQLETNAKYVDQKRKLLNYAPAQVPLHESASKSGHISGLSTFRQALEHEGGKGAGIPPLEKYYTNFLLQEAAVKAGEEVKEVKWTEEAPDPEDDDVIGGLDGSDKKKKKEKKQAVKDEEDDDDMKEDEDDDEEEAAYEEKDDELDDFELSASEEEEQEGSEEEEEEDDEAEEEEEESD